MKRSTPLARTPFRQKPAAEKSVARSTFKKKAPKKRPGHNKAMLNACRGQPCYLVYPGICRGAVDAETVVPAHSNEGAHGKGGALKARDEFTIPACWRCHAEHDQGKLFTYEEKVRRWRIGYGEWAPTRARLYGLAYTEIEDVEFMEIE
ncbi:nuclease domain-containing protein [Caballeronia zhejiangensis]|nr:nuclease domain-containing protein [Caballeronia zhejiangensis]